MADETPLYVVRMWESYEGYWFDLTRPVSKEEADKVYNDHTKNGTQYNVEEYNRDYCKIFPADTRMWHDTPKAESFS